MAAVKRIYYINEDLDMAPKLKAVKEHMDYSEVVIAPLQ